MWEVVKRVKGKETIAAGGLTYSAAFAEYEPLAAKFNTQDAEGNYLHPDVRISVRKES